MYIPSGLNISSRTIAKEMMYNNQVILKYSCSYPVYSSYEYYPEAARLSVYYKLMTDHMIDYVKHKLYMDALADFKHSQGRKKIFYPYDVNVTYSVTNNHDFVASQYMDLYEYTGGAHGNTKRISETWNVRQGRIMKLVDFFENDEQYIRIIQNEIIEQIADIPNNKTIFFDDYKELVKKKLNIENFYLVDKGIIVYFQQYDIAPYSSGIPSFIVKCF